MMGLLESEPPGAPAVVRYAAVIEDTLLRPRDPAPAAGGAGEEPR